MGQEFLRSRRTWRGPSALRVDFQNPEVGSEKQGQTRAPTLAGSSGQNSEAPQPKTDGEQSVAATPPLMEQAEMQSARTGFSPSFLLFFFMIVTYRGDLG